MFYIVYISIYCFYDAYINNNLLCLSYPMLLLLPLPPYQIEWEPILVHVAHAEGQRFPYEVILRSVLKHLVDAASNEFLFLCDFFKTQPKDTFNR